jgi:hypothetical protein
VKEMAKRFENMKNHKEYKQKQKHRQARAEIQISTSAPRKIIGNAR